MTMNIAALERKGELYIQRVALPLWGKSAQRGNPRRLTAMVSVVAAKYSLLWWHVIRWCWCSAQQTWCFKLQTATIFSNWLQAIYYGTVESSRNSFSSNFYFRAIAFQEVYLDSFMAGRFTGAALLIFISSLMVMGHLWIDCVKQIMIIIWSKFVASMLC